MAVERTEKRNRIRENNETVNYISILSESRTSFRRLFDGSFVGHGGFRLLSCNLAEIDSKDSKREQGREEERGEGEREDGDF